MSELCYHHRLEENKSCRIFWRSLNGVQLSCNTVLGFVLKKRVSVLFNLLRAEGKVFLFWKSIPTLWILFLVYVWENWMTVNSATSNLVIGIIPFRENLWHSPSVLKIVSSCYWLLNFFWSHKLSTKCTINIAISMYSKCLAGNGNIWRLMLTISCAFCLQICPYICLFGVF